MKGYGSINAARRAATGFLAAAFLVCLGSSCERRTATDWPAATAAAEVAHPPASSVSESSSSPVAPQNEEVPHEILTPTDSTATPDSTSPQSLRFIAYNVQNWLTMERFHEGKILKDAPKPDKEKDAAILILARHNPDVIGLCEIGTAADLAEIQTLLKSAGTDLPHLHYTGGSDPTRHLGLLSRFPITSTAKPAESEYTLDGQTFAINRGILDATIDARGKSFRFLGVHLKSKRDSEQGDQASIRLHEARLVRRHVDAILTAEPAARVVLYGDFNDTRSTPVIKAITGKYNSPTYLTAIPAKDSSGLAWTHFWALNDIYSRIDFIMVSPALKPEVNFRSSKIIDDSEWNDASDHRPLLGIFR